MANSVPKDCTKIQNELSDNEMPDITVEETAEEEEIVAEKI